MPSPSDRLQWLNQQLNDLSISLNNAASSQERIKSLRRMKILIDEIDAVILASLKGEIQGIKNPPQDKGVDVS